jgi:hypothetical protein
VLVLHGEIGTATLRIPFSTGVAGVARAAVFSAVLTDRDSLSGQDIPIRLQLSAFLGAHQQESETY